MLDLTTLKKCKKCGLNKPLSEWQWGSTSWLCCRDCSRQSSLIYSREKRKNNLEWAKEQNRKAVLKRRCNLTLEEYKEIYTKQNGKCVICNIFLEILCVDHCHKTNKFRALICRKCNTALGQVNDNINILESMRDYLIKHSDMEIQFQHD